MLPGLFFFFFQTGLYRHYVYAYDRGLQFLGAQVQVHAYNALGLQYSLHADKDGAVRNSDPRWRFWHTFG